MKAICRLMLGGMLAAVALFGQGTPLPYTRIQLFDNSGRPLASGQLCTYLSGTSTPRATFSDYLLTQPNAQCVVLDSAGRASIWLDSTVVYRIVLKDSTGVTVWTQDGIPGSGSGILTSGNLWTQNGSTVYNSSGNKVCIGATACTTALATLNINGTSSGTNFLFRIDDTGNNPGINLYGSGTSYGSISADPTGLRLRANDGSIQATISPSQFLVRNTAASGTSQLNVQATATQGSARMMQFLTNTGTTMTFVDQLGRVVTTDTNSDSIFAANGGVAGKYLTATDSLFLLAEAQPPLSGAGQARIYLDNSNQLYASINGGAYAVIGSGGGGGGGGGSFSSITGGTNITAAMLVGTGASLGVTGSGTINATSINSTTVPVNAAADQVILTTASATGSWADIPGCLDSGGNHLNYNTSTHAFSCGTTGGSVGSVSFSGITGSTNTSAAMVVGVGSSITPVGIGVPTIAGTGVVNANAFNGSQAPASGSIWKSNSSLQPATATAADIVAMFSGCSGTQYLGADGGCHTASGGGSFLPISGGTMTGSILFSPTVDIGSSANPPRNIWAGTSFTSLNNASNTLNLPNGGLLALNGTFGSLSNYIVVQGTTPQINAGSLGGAFNINGAFSGNGNIVFNPGFVSGLSSVQVNGRSFSNTTTHSLIVNDVGGAAGAGISMKHGGTFDAAWQAGGSTALDIVGNDAFTHRLIVLQTGTTLIGRTSDNGSGALLQVQGGISFTGNMFTPSGFFGTSGTFSCSGSQRIQSITVSGGIVTALNCN